MTTLQQVERRMQERRSGRIPAGVPVQDRRGEGEGRRITDLQRLVDRMSASCEESLRIRRSQS